MRSPDGSLEHGAALQHTEQVLASEFRNPSKHTADKPDFDIIYKELTSLRAEDSKLYGKTADEQFSRDFSDINHYLQSKNLPVLDAGAKDIAPKIEQDLKEAQKSHDFSNVYGRLDALKSDYERKYGKQLGDLLFSQETQDLNRYFHKYGLPDLTITDDGNSVTEQHGHHKKVISNSQQEARQQSRAARHAPYQGGTPEARAGQAAAGHASSAMGDYIKKGGSDQSGALVGLTGGEKATSNEIMNNLVNQYGLSPAGAAGVVGNMTQENQLSTAANSGGIGLCQWIGSRAVEERQFAQANGESPTSMKAQIGFMMHELNRDYPQLLQTLKTTDNPQQAALAFSRIFERPGNPQNGNRMGYATAAKNNFDATQGSSAT